MRVREGGEEWDGSSAKSLAVSTVSQETIIIITEWSEVVSIIGQALLGHRNLSSRLLQ